MTDAFHGRTFSICGPLPTHGRTQLCNKLLHNCRGGTSPNFLDKADTRQHRDCYAAAAVDHGWSRNVLLNMIMNRTLERTGAAPSNFVQRLVGQDSDLAQQVAKDPYSFEFLGLSGEVAERDLELALTSRIAETLRELGPGFSFVGRRPQRQVQPWAVNLTHGSCRLYIRQAPRLRTASPAQRRPPGGCPRMGRT